MDLFTYLGAKNGKFTLPHKSDLFSYLLGKNSKLPIQTASGMTLEITAKKSNVLELTLDKMCSQDGTPTPDNPIEVNMAEGYRNLLDNTNLTYQQSNVSDTYNQLSTLPTGIRYKTTYNGGSPTIVFKSFDLTQYKGKTIYMKSSFTGNGAYIFGLANSDLSTKIQKGATTTSGSTLSFEIPNDLGTTPYLYYSLRVLDATGDNTVDYNDLIITFNIDLPYVPYGTNYINLNITDGVNSINKQIPLNDNFIGGIGDYKDVLTIDESGSISLVKNIGKVVLDGSESWSGINSYAVFYINVDDAQTISASTMPQLLSNYYTPQIYNSMYNSSVDYGVGLHSSTPRILIRNKDCANTTALQTWLSTHNTTVYYVLATPTEIDLGNIDISLFKGSNIITNSDNCNMTIKYY